MDTREITLGILATAGIIALGFFSPSIIEDGKLVLIQETQTAQVYSSVPSQKSLKNVNNSTSKYADMDDCDYSKIQLFTNGRDSVKRSINQHEFCSDLEISSELIESNITTVDREVIYRTTVTNHGPHDAHAIHVQGNIPRDFVFTKVSGNIDLGSYASSRDDYFIQELVAGTTTFIDIAVEIPPISCGFVHENHAYIESFAGFDYDKTNNINSERIAVPTCPKWERVYSF